MFICVRNQLAIHLSPHPIQESRHSCKRCATRDLTSSDPGDMTYRGKTLNPQHPEWI